MFRQRSGGRGNGEFALNQSSVLCYVFNFSPCTEINRVL